MSTLASVAEPVSEQRLQQWSLRPSKRQRWLDALTLLVLAALISPYFWAYLLLFLSSLFPAVSPSSLFSTALFFPSFFSSGLPSVVPSLLLNSLGVLLVAFLLSGMWSWSLRCWPPSFPEMLRFQPGRSAQQGQWQVYLDGQWQPLAWRAGSVRRRTLVIAQWGFWPWQRFYLRADNFADDEAFRRFRAALYLHWR